MKYFPQTISAAKEIEEERKQEESAKLKVDFNDDDDQLDESIRANHCFFVQEMEEEFGEDRLGRLRTRLWDLLEYPETSKVLFSYLPEGITGCFFAHTFQKVQQGVFLLSGKFLRILLIFCLQAAQIISLFSISFVLLSTCTFMVRIHNSQD